MAADRRGGVVLTKLERILERAELHLTALRGALQAGGDSGSGPIAVVRAGPVENESGVEESGSSADASPRADVDARGGTTGPVGQRDRFVEPDLSGIRSTAEAIQRCLAPLVAESGTAVLSDTRGLLVAGVGTAEVQENLAAVGALAAQMAFRSAELISELDPRTLVLGGRGQDVVAATLFPIEDEYFVLTFRAPARFHRSSLVSRVISWIRPLIVGEVRR